MNTVAVAICTYRRNEALRTLLGALLLCAEKVRGQAMVGVVIVDDTADGQARGVAEAFRERFELGLNYRISGKQNISLARNCALEAAIEVGDWVATIDDDCEPPPDWLAALLDVQRRRGADAVTGRMRRKVPADAPDWIREEPFLELGVEVAEDGAEMPAGSTFNSLISAEWLKSHSAIRFQPSFGVIGGEDMVFFRAAREAGMRICYSEKGYVFENEPPERATLSYQLRLFFWHGNSACLASVESGVSRVHMLRHGLASLVRATARPVARLLHGETPQSRYTLALMLHAIGKLVGVMGMRIDHK